MNTSSPLVIFSAERSIYGDDINATRTQFLQRQLEQRSISYKLAHTIKDGRKEEIFIVMTHEGTYESMLIESLANRYGQRCILYVDANGLAYIRYMDNSPDEDLGRFQEVTPYDASRKEQFTYIDGKYYSTGVR